MDLIPVKNYSISISKLFSEQDDFTRIIGSGNYNSVFVLADTNTEKYCLPFITSGLSSHRVIRIEPGEKNKTINTCSAIWQQLAEGGATRNSLLINLGGGVIGDMGGFCAATFKRGIDFINIPTTLLAMVDASVGGKTGIDVDGIKNLVGLFQDPKHIFISSVFLSSLPSNQLRSGFAEMIKHGLISDRNYWNEVKEIQPDMYRDWQHVIRRSVEIKKQVVESDPYESGIRKTLNFGHTVGHAIETLSLMRDEQPLLHGEAIAAGMICEAWLSAKVNGLPASSLDDIVAHILLLFPKYKLAGIEYAALHKLMKMDKKNDGDKIQFSLLHEIGNCGFNIAVPDMVLQEAYNFYCNL
jgi:3-dehydroquinate synthase